MNRIGFLACLLAVTGPAAWARADASSSSTARVVVEVTPKIAVSSVASPHIQSVQSGKVEVVITFFVEANLHEASLYVEASDLYKGDDPTNDEVHPIPLDTTAAAVIDPAHARPRNGGSNLANWIGAGTPIGAYESRLSETICFESSEDYCFGQEVDVTVTWNQDDPDKPTGQYGGIVRLTAVATPE